MFGRRRPAVGCRLPKRPSHRLLALLPLLAAAVLGGCAQQAPSYPDIGQDLSANVEEQPLIPAVSAWGGDAHYFVNLFNGGFVVDKPMIEVPALGFDWDVRLFYNSTRALEVTDVGAGWHFSYDLRLAIDTPAPGAITVHWGDGRRDILTFDSVHWVGPAWMHGTTIDFTGGAYHLRTKHGKIYVFDAIGRLVQLIDRNGNTWVMSYNGSGQLAVITDPSGRTLTLSYDGAGHITQMSGLPAAPIQLTYSGDLLAQVLDAAGNGTNYSYDAGSRLTLAVDAEGASVQVQFHPTVDAVIRVTAGASEREFSYNPFSLTTTVVDHLDATRTCLASYTMDGAGLVVRAVGPDGTATNAYDPATHMLAAHVDVNGRTSTRTVDGLGNVTGFTDPTGATTSWAYNPTYSFVVSTTDAVGNTSTRTLDAAGNVIAETNELGLSVSIARTARGQVQSVTTPLGATMTNAFNLNGDLVQSTDPSGASVQATFNARGRPLTLTDQAANTLSLGYDNDDRIVSVALPRGGTYAMTYTGVGRLASITDPMSAAWHFAFNERHQLTSHSDPFAAVATIERDRAGAVMRLVDALGHSQAYTRDRLERVTSFRDPDGGTWTLTPAPGDLTEYASITDPLGAIENRTYTARYELASRNFGGGLVASYVMDALGRWVHAQRSGPALPVVAYDRTFDAAGRVTQQVASHLARTTTFGFDNDDDLVSLSDNLRPAPVIMVFDQRDLVKRISMTAPVLNTDIAVSPQLELASFIHSNGVTTNYGQDADGCLNLIHTLGIGFTAQYSIDRNLRDDAIRVSGTSPALPTLDHALGRDLDGCLRDENLPFSLVSRHYDFDLVRNRILRLVPPGVPETYAYSAANRLQSVVAGPVVKTLVWNSAGYVTSANEPGSAITVALNADRSYKTLTQNAQTWQFLSGPFGEMVRVIEPGGATTWFCEDRGAGGVLRRAEFATPATAPVTEYVYATGALAAVAGPVALAPTVWNRTPYSAANLRIVTAGVQGPAQVTTNTGALLSDRYDDRYGNKIAQSGSIRPRAGFEGMDSFSGLNLMMTTDLDLLAHSWYDPATGIYHLDKGYGSKLRSDQATMMGPRSIKAIADHAEAVDVEQPIWNRTPHYATEAEAQAAANRFRLARTPEEFWRNFHATHDNSPGAGVNLPQGCGRPDSDWPRFIKAPGDDSGDPEYAPDQPWGPLPPGTHRNPIATDMTTATHGFSVEKLRAILMALGQNAIEGRTP